MYHQRAAPDLIADDALQRVRDVIGRPDEAAGAGGSGTQRGELRVDTRREELLLRRGLLSAHGSRVGREPREPLLSARRHDGEREKRDARYRERQAQRHAPRTRDRFDDAHRGGEETDR